MTVPNSGGAKGNLIAAAMGALIARPEAKLEILAHADSSLLEPASALCAHSDYSAIHSIHDFYVEVILEGDTHQARCILAGGHTHLVQLEKDGDAAPLDAFSTAESGR